MKNAIGKGKDMIYLYDGSYQGFLTAVYANYYEKRATEVVSLECSPGLFLDESRTLATEPEKAQRVERALFEKCGLEVMNWVYYAFHAAEPQKDTWLLRFVERAFRLGRRVINALSEREVLRISNLAKRVSRERHAFLGFVRFEEVIYGRQSYLYSRIEPKNDILALMGEHFADRFYRERIVIHDAGRGTALFALEGQWEIGTFSAEWKEIRQSRSCAEEGFQQLWRGYFEHIAIEERKSDKRQKQFVPLQYRRNLTEFQA